MKKYVFDGKEFNGSNYKINIAARPYYSGG
jgi:hypothetical protein